MQTIISSGGGGGGVVSRSQSLYLQLRWLPETSGGGGGYEPGLVRLLCSVLKLEARRVNCVVGALQTDSGRLQENPEGMAHSSVRINQITPSHQ